jgi:hypothetical protein
MLHGNQLRQRQLAVGQVASAKGGGHKASAAQLTAGRKKGVGVKKHPCGASRLRRRCIACCGGAGTCSSTPQA